MQKIKPLMVRQASPLPTKPTSGQGPQRLAFHPVISSLMTRCLVFGLQVSREASKRALEEILVSRLEVPLPL